MLLEIGSHHHFTLSQGLGILNMISLFETNFLWNRIDFLEEHKLSPILLIWLHLGVWENVFPAQTPGFVGV